ncbi:glycoside hydrolase/deacetylase [Sistotremastrum niveocremeum HHB9708]|uniref:chitin deacetylase n=1 Tax=Sistotremastrum niveocremeum HHB9708 TaxID=1314777 RepID=A0A164XPP4_9AGAM|nr:glycoside hydrolase/deacetylase [Sistotremastrum niveocremeum HHB9708]
MKFSFLALGALPVVLSATTGSSSSSSSSAAAAPAPSSSITTTIPGSGAPTGVTSPPASSPPTVPVTLITTNPTAYPLSSIFAGAPAQPTTTLDTIYPAGASPTAVIGAPSLPDISQLNPANYPPLDKPPPTDSSLVQGWIQQVQNSGIPIPGFAPTQVGGCPTNQAAAANASSSGTCWWTCGHCSRPTDIVTCENKLTWGTSFDDGPSPYTPNLLQFLDEHSLKTTFFIVGSRAISRPQMLQTQYMDGHQLSVHTWSHTALTTQTNEAIIAEFGWTKKVIKDVTGVTPNTFRPPYGDIDDRVRAIARAMDLTPIIWTTSPSGNFTFDTNDFNIPGGTVSASQVLNNFEQIMQTAPQLNTGFIVLEHDLFQQTVDLATGYILPQALAQQPPLTLQPIIECLGKPLSDAYVETNNNSTNPPPSGSAGATGVVTLTSGAPGSIQSPTAQPASSSSGSTSSNQSSGALRLDMSPIVALGFAVFTSVAAAFVAGL